MLYVKLQQGCCMRNADSCLRTMTQVTSNLLAVTKPILLTSLALFQAIKHESDDLCVTHVYISPWRCLLWVPIIDPGVMKERQ